MLFQHKLGHDISDDMYELTSRTGLMQDWLNEERQNMVAIIYEKDGVCYGWCAYVFLHSKLVKIGTFVDESCRGTGLGRKLLKEALAKLAETNPGSTVRYGGSKYRKFDTIYKKEILQAKLNPDHHFGLYRGII